MWQRLVFINRNQKILMPGSDGPGIFYLNLKDTSPEDRSSDVPSGY